MYIYIYIYFSLTFSHWQASPSVLLTPGLPLPAKPFRCWAHFGDRGKCPGQMLAPSTVSSLWNIFRPSLCQQKDRRNKEEGGIFLSEEKWEILLQMPMLIYTSQQHRGCLSHFFPKAAQNRRSRKWPSPHSLSFTKHLKPYASALLSSASFWRCPWDRNLPYLNNLLT